MGNEKTRDGAEELRCLQCEYCWEDTELEYNPVYRCRKYPLSSNDREIHLYSGEGGGRMNWCPIVNKSA